MRQSMSQGVWNPDRLTILCWDSILAAINGKKHHPWIKLGFITAVVSSKTNSMSLEDVPNMLCLNHLKYLMLNPACHGLLSIWKQLHLDQGLYSIQWARHRSSLLEERMMIVCLMWYCWTQNHLQLELSKNRLTYVPNARIRVLKRAQELASACVIMKMKSHVSLATRSKLTSSRYCLTQRQSSAWLITLE